MELENKAVIEIEDLEMSFGSKKVLKGISLQVYPGQVIGYIGPNGAGKSTTIKIILGLLSGHTGKIKIFGNEISKDSIEYKKRIGYVPENAEIYDTLTAREYLTFIGELYGKDSKDVEHKAKRMMKIFGIEDVFNSRISSYSKGMKQKVLIISSLLHNPDVLFLDEPLSGLDANSVIIVKEILAELSKKGKTIFYSSHIMDVVEKISNRIVLLQSGSILADGSFSELRDKSQDSSLEEIFNELTGFNQHKEMAKEFISILEEEY
ncbi:ABC transporter ATP-binding protein [Clostridiisalibacter paucivorans]|uniref:ABC transporter ATP-binding protein n=1 Tax=Clostridiisalibacter paucivorans TaxID=408753 RepID=UPI00047908ED|nr:ABC transporter ATP-binding protein [Clostridiisalibacter paucivorans]